MSSLTVAGGCVTPTVSLHLFLSPETSLLFLTLAGVTATGKFLSTPLYHHSNLPQDKLRSVYPKKYPQTPSRSSFVGAVIIQNHGNKPHTHCCRLLFNSSKIPLFFTKPEEWFVTHSQFSTQYGRRLQDQFLNTRDEDLILLEKRLQELISCLLGMPCCGATPASPTQYFVIYDRVAYYLKLSITII